MSLHGLNGNIFLGNLGLVHILPVFLVHGLFYRGSDILNHSGSGSDGLVLSFARGVSRRGLSVGLGGGGAIFGELLEVGCVGVVGSSLLRVLCSIGGGLLAKFAGRSTVRLELSSRGSTGGLLVAKVGSRSTLLVISELGTVDLGVLLEALLHSPVDMLVFGSGIDHEI